MLVALIVPLGALIGFALWHRHTPLHDAVPTAVAAVVTLVPEGEGFQNAGLLPQGNAVG